MIKYIKHKTFILVNVFEKPYNIAQWWLGQWIIVKIKSTNAIKQSRIMWFGTTKNIKLLIWFSNKNSILFQLNPWNYFIATKYFDFTAIPN